MSYVYPGFCYVGHDVGAHADHSPAANFHTVADCGAESDESIGADADFSAEYSSWPDEDVVFRLAVVFYDGAGVDDAMIADGCSVDHAAVHYLCTFADKTRWCYYCGGGYHGRETVSRERFDKFASDREIRPAAIDISAYKPGCSRRIFAAQSVIIANPGERHASGWFRRRVTCGIIVRIHYLKQGKGVATPSDQQYRRG